MALSPNYSWAEPDNSSLVKNGASDIRTLGDAIDTSVWNVGFGQAGKNKLMNADFSINQRAFTSNTTSQTYNFDRWIQTNAGGTVTVTPQTFTVGTAPVTGYESVNFLRIDTTGQTLTSSYANISQRMESVRTFANQTVTVSFWAKAATGTPKISMEFGQNFGSGGSSTVNTYAGQATISTSWARYSASVTVPSISGKTLGANNFLAINLWTSAGSDFNARLNTLGLQNNTIDFWGVQVEYGSKMTPFQTASGGSPQAELAMCQRYYYRTSASASYPYAHLGFTTWYTNATTSTAMFGVTPVPMRIAPTSVDYAGTLGLGALNAGSVSVTSITLNQVTPTTIAINAVATTVLSTYYTLGANNSATAYVGFSAEL
jgi:hypothetical protein